MKDFSSNLCKLNYFCLRVYKSKPNKKVLLLNMTETMEGRRVLRQLYKLTLKYLREKFKYFSDA
ncbi:hypothetical protein V1477_002175 [Vespula maculifrons]|uniref:Uncharacterized protein n=1 Tax=Vespula maculifrons TaxID=7453 RepID=A0ABD2CVV8_VESMC